MRHGYASVLLLTREAALSRQTAWTSPERTRYGSVSWLWGSPG